jgi:hypothetical protein
MLLQAATRGPSRHRHRPAREDLRAAPGLGQIPGRSLYRRLHRAQCSPKPKHSLMRSLKRSGSRWSFRQTMNPRRLGRRCRRPGHSGRSIRAHKLCGAQGWRVEPPRWDGAGLITGPSETIPA